MADLQGLIRDPDYQALPFAQRRQLLSEADPVFKSAKAETQVQIMSEMKKQPFWKPAASQPTAKPAPKAEPPKKSIGDKAFDVAAEPFRLGAETIAAPINAVVKAGKGLYGLGATANAALHGKSLDESLAAGTEAIGNRNAVTSPLEPSKTGQAIGAVVQPAIKKAGEVTGHPELVNSAMEAGGDIASLFAIKPGVNAAAGAVKNTMKTVAKTQLPEKLYASAAKLPLSKAWTKQLGESGMTKRKAAISAGLEGKVPISEAGIAKAKGLELAHRSAVDSVVAELDKTGRLIPKEKLRSGLGEAYKVADTEGTSSAESMVDRLYDKRFEKMGKMVKTGDKQIPAKYRTDDFGQQVLVEPARVEPIMERQYKPSEIQAIKRHLYKMENYEKQKLSRGLGSQLKELGNKGMAHEAKVALEELHPALKALNKKDAAYINLIEALERAVPRIQNNNVIGLGAKVLATGTHPWAAILEHTLGLPSVKAKFAFALNRARKVPRSQVVKPAAQATAYGLNKTATSPQETPNEP